MEIVVFIAPMEQFRVRQFRKGKSAVLSRTRKAVLRIAVISLFIPATLLGANAASGSFVGVEGESVRGTATVTAKTVKLSSNFRSTSGPDLYVYLGNKRPSKIIARLRKLSGSQTYALPKGVDLSKYSAVYIHCKRYNHTYGKARLR